MFFIVFKHQLRQLARAYACAVDRKHVRAQFSSGAVPVQDVLGQIRIILFDSCNNLNNAEKRTRRENEETASLFREAGVGDEGAVISSFRV